MRREHREVNCGVMNWIDVAQESVHWREHGNELQGSKNARILLTC
jgi:hypothetical protein